MKKQYLFGQPGVDHLAFEIGVALGHQRGLDPRGGHGRQPKRRELVHLSPRAVPAGDHLLRQLHGRDVDRALLVAFRMPKVWLRLLMTQPKIGGSKSSIVCQDMVMTFARPFRAVETSTTGPGSNRP